jgi:hypothetical protein
MKKVTASNEKRYAKLNSDSLVLQLFRSPPNYSDLYSDRLNTTDIQFKGVVEIYTNGKFEFSYITFPTTEKAVGSFI